MTSWSRGPTDPDVIRRLAAALERALNELAVAGMSLDALGRLGVGRVSTGSMPYRVALRAALDTTEAVRQGGDLPGSVVHLELQNSLLAFARWPRVTFRAE